MSEVASRPASTRGRGSGRGGRGGARGSRARDRPNGSYKETPAADDFTDQGELGEMKKQYSSQLPMLKELFQDWTDVDLLFALEETNGDLESTIERISEGHVSKFSDVKSTKEKSKPKPKDTHVTSADAAASTARPSRGRGGNDASRGSRGRVERGRGGSRGGRGTTHATANGTRAPAGTTSIPTTDAWETPTTTDAAATGSWDAPAETSAKPVAAEPAKNNAPAEPAKKTWAQMFAKPPQQAGVPQKAVPEAVLGEEPGVTPSEISSGYVEVTHADVELEDLPEPTPADEITGHDPPVTDEPAEETAAVELTPSKDQLTKENVEHLPDVAQPAPTGTAASTVESSRGPDSVTPSVAGQPTAQPPIGRPAMGGFQTTAYKAAGVGGRSASFNRRLQEQQEAVVMPGNHAVDRTAVQFGSLGLSGDALDVDEDREELETRAQPPQHSPVAAPRASLPPVPRQSTATTDAPIDAPVGPKASTGLPPAPQSQQPLVQQSPSVSATQTQVGSQTGQVYNQFGRFGQGEATAQKSYDPFGQQIPQQSAYETYPSSTQAPTQSSQGLGAFSSSANDYSSYYTADQRSAYQNYYNSYGQQNAGAQQDVGASQQRSGSAFGAAADSSFPTGQPPQTTSRYGDNQSGHTTPNPAPGAQQHGTQPSAGQHPHQQPHGQGQYPGYAQHPYYNSPYYSAYMNQFSPYGQQGFGGQQFNKGGMYNQPHHGYGQNNYDQHSSSPANVSGFGRDSGLGGGLGDYGRTASSQPTQSQQTSSGGYGGGNDSFGRAQGGFPGQGQSYGQNQTGQHGASDDALKPFGDSKASGPSPSALGQPGRPGSATNTPGQGAQSGLPPPQSHQQGFSGYPGHLSQMGGTSQYGGGLGGLGGHTAGAQSHQQGGGYGNSNYGGGFSNYGGSYGGRGGWGGNYGH